ncbi:MAG: hypothetical protein LBI64_06650 [Coriobacteriales bacterium]|jgi:hypothetical protein|nr:hypothetical protein [Coriobacteriales bacterium]
MSIKQLSVFVENKAGHLARITAALEAAKISIRGFSLADTADFGIVRIIVDQPEAAMAALRGVGILARMNDMICIELPDTPGALDEVFTAVGDAGLNVEYAYSLVSTYVVLKVADSVQAEALLANAPVRLVNQEELSVPLSGGVN